MGRPLKTDAERRTLTLRVRVNADEKSHILSKAENAGLTPSDFLRSLAITNTRPERHVPTPDRAILLKLLAELNMNGSNLNQCARALNRRQDSDDLSMIDFDALNRASFGVETMVRHLMEVLG